MNTLIVIIVISTLTFFLGFAIEVSTLSPDNVVQQAAFSMWPVFLLVVMTGSFGGFVHALENEKTHEIKFPFNGTSTDSGVWGHVFIGICGAIVALAIMIAIFGLSIDPVATSGASATLKLKTSIYIAAIGIIGGYSGLPIISLISNAALKKVQKQVDDLQTSDEKKGQELTKVSGNLKAVTSNFTELQTELQAKEQELQYVKLKSSLLSAESHARNGFPQEAIDELLTKYLPEKIDEPKVYHWLAVCEKRLGNYQAALDYVCKSLELEKNRLGYFNLACYKHLLDKPNKEVYDALRSAWAYSTTFLDKERLVNSLQSDEDLTKLRDNEKEFQDLLSRYETELEQLEK